jgi:transcription antitermination factor NusG
MPQTYLESAQEERTGADLPVLSWYAFYTHARREKRVHEVFQQRGFESYLPVATRMRQWHDRRKLIEWPLFPSYVFGRFRAPTLEAVLKIAGVADIVRFGSRPATIPEEEIDNIARFARALGQAGIDPPRVPFKDGCAVRIVAGPFQGVYGTVPAADRETPVLVGLRALGMGFEVEVPAQSRAVLH